MNDPDICNMKFSENKLVEKWNLFKTAFLDLSKKHAPIKTMRVKDRYCPWVDKDIVKLMYARNHAKKCAVKTTSEALWQKFKYLRNLVTLKIKQAKKKYYNDKIADCGNDSKKMWKFINRITGSKTYKPPHKDLDCNTFNEHFSSIGEKLISQESSEPEDLPWKHPHVKLCLNFN